MRAPIANVVMACVIGALVPPAGADDHSRPLAVKAFALCQRVDVSSESDRAARIALLEEGVDMSEAAVVADESDARAHLALCCNLGKQIEISGLSWRVFERMHRAHAAIDRAHELAPTDPDILVAKGEMLRRLPSPLGGDKAAGLELIRRAVEIAPDHVAARLFLARAMADEGAPDARKCVREALAVAERAGAERDRSEARALLASLE
jgi:tetratricopeptide (TPR) repeat protein